MLTQLTVKNFTLVDFLELEFHPGMSVISGETGTGKSIILNALGLALGDRADTSLIASGANRAEISAAFDIRGNDDAIAWLHDRELLDPGATDCILRRLVGADGRSRGFINGTPSTVADMQILGDMLMDIHSQHEHQSLMKRETQRRLLDEFGDLVELAEQVRSLYQEYKDCKERLGALIERNEEQSSRLQLLNYQADELSQLAVKPGEYEKLAQEQKRLANAESILRHCHEAIEICRQDDSANVIDQISRAINLLDTIDDDAVNAIVELLDSSRIQIEEAVHDLERFRDEFEADPNELLQVESRLSQIFEVARKHRIEPAGIPDLETRIRDELASLSTIDNDIDELSRKVEELKDRYDEAAGRLSDGRQKAAGKLEKKVFSQLAELGMSGATLSVDMTPVDQGEPSPRGRENIEFLISTNPGQDPRPLNKIASGGELSRISLAIQVIAADTSNIPTLVLDEVDVGIGGAVAEVVGRLLRQLSTTAQIICVTHLPQVAAQGHRHYRVTKSTGASHAATQISPLTDEQKVAEIARMLGGVEMTEQSVAHAEEMFKKAQGGD